MTTHDSPPQNRLTAQTRMYLEIWTLCRSVSPVSLCTMTRLLAHSTTSRVRNGTGSWTTCASVPTTPTAGLHSISMVPVRATDDAKKPHHCFHLHTASEYADRGKATHGVSLVLLVSLIAADTKDCTISQGRCKRYGWPRTARMYEEYPPRRSESIARGL